MAEANIKNLERIELFADAVVRLRDGARKNTDDIREQLQRVSLWLGQEMPEYWGNELRIAKNRWTEAREELLRCESKPRAEDETSCLVQRKALEKATARRNLCEQRVRLAPQLLLQWEQFAQEISVSVRHLEDMTESRLPLATTHLQQTIDLIKRYASLESDRHE